MNISVSVLLVAGSLAPLQVLQAADGDKEKEKEKLQGTWAAISLVDSGRKEKEANVKRLKLKIKGDKYTYVIGTASFSAVYKIDTTKTPRQMDVTFEEGPQKGKTMRAIYSLKGDELKICGGFTRPADFVSKPKSKVVLFVFKRERP